jgi:thiol-disulfide isomerase/thioredoxin
MRGAHQCEARGAGASRQARVAALIAAQCCALALVAGVAAHAATPEELPAFTHPRPASWLNSAPLDAGALRGHPVLVEVWTFECSNCLASLAWMHRVEARYRGTGLQIIGVHSPELADERDPRQVAAAVRRLHIEYPVMLDEDFSYWQRLGNHYWPAFYLYDAGGRLIGTRIGELHAGEPSADAFERLIAAQLPALPAR